MRSVVISLFCLWFQAVLRGIRGENYTIYVGRSNEDLEYTDGSFERPYPSLFEAYESFWNFFPSLKTFETIEIKFLPGQVLEISGSRLTFDKGFGKNIIFSTIRENDTSMQKPAAQILFTDSGSLFFDSISTRFSDLELVMSDKSSSLKTGLAAKNSVVQLTNITIKNTNLLEIARVFEMEECSCIEISDFRITGVLVRNNTSVFFIKNKQTQLRLGVSRASVKNCEFENFSRFLELELGGDLQTATHMVVVSESYFSAIRLRDSSKFFDISAKSEVSLEAITLTSNLFAEFNINSNALLFRFKSQQERLSLEKRNSLTMAFNLLQNNVACEPIYVENFASADFYSNVFESNSFRGSLMNIQNSQNVSFVNTLIQKNGGQGNFIIYHASENIEIADLTIINLNFSNVFGIYHVRQSLRISRVRAMNTDAFCLLFNQVHLLNYTKIGGCFDILNANGILMKNLIFSNIVLINSGAIKLKFERTFEDEFEQALEDDAKRFFSNNISEVLFTNNSLNSFPEAASLIQVTSLSSKTRLWLTNLLFYNNSLETAPGYHLSAACLLIDALMYSKNFQMSLPRGPNTVNLPNGSFIENHFGNLIEL